MRPFLCFLSAVLGVVFGAQAATTINPANSFAFGANLGWIDWRGDAASGAVIGESVCSGHLYAANAGWINLGSGAPANGVRYANLSADDFGVNHDGLGNLQGQAWGANIGWLTFTNRDATGAYYDGPKVDLFTGKLSGYVWAANVGWISLSNAVALVQTDAILPGADADHDGIPDAWELANFGNLITANAAGDYDGDGLSDLNEYIAGTDPKDPGSNLRITSCVAGSGGSPTSLTWLSQPMRQYRILRTGSLNAPIFWSDVGLGLVLPDAGGSTSRSFTDPSGLPGSFYRIQAIRPLAP